MGRGGLENWIGFLGVHFRIVIYRLEPNWFYVCVVIAFVCYGKK